MLVIRDEELKYFDWQGAAQNNAWELHDDEWEILEGLLDEAYPHGIRDWTLQNLFEKHFDKVCAMLGLKYDATNYHIIREDEE